MAGGLRSNDQRFVVSRCQSGGDFATKRFKRCVAFFFTDIQKDLKRNCALFFKLLYAVSVKVSSPIQVDEFTAEHFNIRFIGNDGSLSADFESIAHHGLYPSFSSHFLTEFTAPLSVSGFGCGR